MTAVLSQTRNRFQAEKMRMEMKRRERSIREAESFELSEQDVHVQAL